MFITSYRLKQMVGGATYNQLGALLTSGRVSEAGLRRYYSRARQTALKRVKAAEKAGLAFWNPPEFRRIKNLVTTSDLLHEIADVNRFLKAPTTVGARRADIAEKVSTMHERNMFLFVNESNYSTFARFMDWARATSRLTTYSSESDEIELTAETVVQTGARTAAEFEDLFNSVLDSMI